MESNCTLKIIDVKDVRPCGDCQACCSIMAVKELQKENYTRCQHQCAGGCGVYQDRPQSCQTFDCWYRAGLVKHRPDKIGVIVDYYPMQDVICVWEVRPGASETKRVTRMIKSLRKTYPASLIHIVNKENAGSLADTETAEYKDYEIKAKRFARDLVKNL